MYAVHFNCAGDQEKIVAMGPWHFRQDFIAMKVLHEEPCEKDKRDCRVQLWVQIHHASLQQMTKILVY
jgi:hypothetical protein